MKIIFFLIPVLILSLIPTIYAETYSSIPSSEDSTTSGIGTTCSGRTYAGLAGVVRTTYDATICRVPFSKYDITSIPSIAVVTNATWTYGITSATITSSCYIFDYTDTPNGNQATYDAVFTAAGIASANNDCQSTGDNKIFVMNSTGLAKIQNNISSGEGFYALGLWFSTEPVLAQSDTIRSANATLTITYYTVPPDRISNLAVSIPATTTTIGLGWTAPSAGGGNQYITGYQLNLTAPQTGSPLVYINDTGVVTTNYNFTGLLYNSEYSARISAWTNNTFGHPFNNATGNILNFTTGINSAIPIPTNFLMLPNGTSASVLLLNWTAPLINNLNGYKIACEAPVGNGFSVISANTSSTVNNYNYTGLSVNTYYNCKVAGLNGSGASDYSNTYSQTTYHLSTAVDDLMATTSSFISIILTWTQPDTLYGYLRGYEINYTTPVGDPTSIYLASTGSSSVTYTVTGLTSSLDYSFRVAAVTIHGINATGANVSNATAVNTFTIGNLTLPTGVSSNVIPIHFEVDTVNSTTSNLVVTYDSSYALACDFSYPVSHTNTTYTGLAEHTISGSSVYSNFTLNGYGNNLIDVYCWDTNDNNTNGRDRLGTSSIPLVNQISSFRTGAFGTNGMFGALDFVTLIVVIVAMVGFNRSHPVVGVVIMVIILGGLAWYHVIQIPTVIMGIIALMVTLAIVYGRRDDAD